MSTPKQDFAGSWYLDEEKIVDGKKIRRLVPKNKRKGKKVNK